MEKTQKLYYKDAYLKNFTATVLSCEECDGGFSVVLDRTAFFPEEGGQYSDSGVINGRIVSQVKEREGCIYHYLDSAVEVGATVACTLLFKERFDKMQQHSAEHLASGIIHSLYGAENVGFHLGPHEVTFDTDIPLSKEMLAEVEERVNQAIYENREITSSFPEPQELSALVYRSKLDLTEDVRLVTIDGYDVCACCAPHVSSTGELGIVKFIYSEKHKGGTRVYMVAGNRAYKYLSSVFDGASDISRLLSVPVTDVAEEVNKLNDAKVNLEYALSEKGKEIAAIYADSLPETDGNLTVHLSHIAPADLREFANLAGNRVSGILVALSGNDGDFKYVIKSSGRDVSEFIREANASLSGRGGGRGAMAQGSFAATFDEIKKYFENI